MGVVPGAGAGEGGPLKRQAATGVAALAAALSALASPPAPVTAAAAAPPTTADVTRLARPFLPRLRRSGVPVVLPARVPLASHYARLYSGASSSRGSFVFGVDAARDCGGANACFVAGFVGERGKPIPGRPTLRLRGGVPALFLAGGCGASCAPASLFFRYRGGLYSWQVKDLRGQPRSTLVALANEALAAGPR